MRNIYFPLKELPLKLSFVTMATMGLREKQRSTYLVFPDIHFLGISRNYQKFSIGMYQAKFLLFIQILKNIIKYRYEIVNGPPW